MKAIKHILTRYTHWIWNALAPLGPWGIFLVSVADGAFVGLPVDAVVASYVYHDRPHFLFYVVMASAGSAAGSCVLYLIGYLGGEALVRKRVPAAQYQRIHNSFEKHEFWAVIFPAMLPPPFPFKLFVLAAAVAEMRFVHFLGATIAGRLVRFMILAVLTIKFGPQFVHFTEHLFRQHFRWVLVAAAVVLVLWLVWRQRGREDSRLRTE